MAIVTINIGAYINPPLYNVVQLAFFESDQVCYKPKSDYQISTVNFEAGSLIYKIDNSFAAIGWYSDGINRGQWNGTAIISFIPCEVATTGIAVPSQTGSSHCSTGICLLNGSLASITVYTTSGILSPGQTVWADLGMTTLYLTSSYIKQVGHSELYTVNGSGILSSPQCSEGGSCGI